MNHFLITQINEEGNETGIVKLIEGFEETARYINRDEQSPEQKDKNSEVLKNMNPGEFETLNSGKFIYEIDCISDEEAKDLEVENSDKIGAEKTAVYEIFVDNKDIDYAFGREDLNKKLVDLGFSLESVNDLEMEIGKESFLELEDPKHISVTVKPMNDRDVEKMIQTNQAFALDYETMIKEPSNLNEAYVTDVEEFIKDGLFVKIQKTPNDRFFYQVYTDKKKLFLTQCSFFRSAVEAKKDFEERISDPNSILSIDAKEKLSRLNENSDDMNNCISYLGKEIKLITKDGKVFVNVNGKRYGSFNESGTAEAFGRYLVESGIEQSTEIEFSVSVAKKAAEAIDDNPYLKHNTTWIGTNVLEIPCEDEDCDLLDEVKEQLSAFGITEEEYEVRQAIGECDNEQTLNESFDVNKLSGKVQSNSEKVQKLLKFGQCCGNCKFASSHSNGLIDCSVHNEWILQTLICDKFEMNDALEEDI